MIVIDYKAGNVRSLLNRLSDLGCKADLSDDPDTIAAAPALIFPGVGAAASAMDNLRKAELVEVIQNFKKPFLGICLGMQLMGRYSEEGESSLLALMDFQVERFKGVSKIPHMGWNSVENTSGPLFKGFDSPADFYFVHSYRVAPGSFTVAQSAYGAYFSAAVQKDNFFGCQFHPEKSARAGARILQNFISL